MPRRTLAVAAAALALANPLANRGARADSLTATLGQPLVETSHEVDITVSGGVARYRVRRAFHNRGAIADEASLDIDLPFGGAVTGLRIKARDTWYDGDLMEADAAARLYQELTGLGPFPVKDPALLQWVWADKVHLQLFPVLPGRDALVEYTLTVPTRYERGVWHLSYPRDPGPGLAAPGLVVHPDERLRDDEVHLRFDGVEAVAGVRYALPAPTPDQPAGAGLGVAMWPHASYAASEVTIADSQRARGPLRSAVVDLRLAHTYAGDLRIELVSPSGEVALLRDRKGGTTNDVRERLPVTLTRTPAAAGQWRLVVSDHAPRDVGTLDHWGITVDTGRGAPLHAEADPALFLADAPEGDGDRGLIDIALAAPPIDTIEARLGRVVASSRHAFLRLEVDAARELAPLPRGASIVFAIDASRSVGTEGIEAQLAVVRAILSHLPDAAVEIVLFRRRAARLFGGFVPAAEVALRVEEARRRGALAPGNGSALELGLAAALEAVRGRAGPQRVIVTSDAALRSSFDVAAARGLLARGPEGVIAHVVVSGELASDEVTLARDDGHELSPLATGGHGILARLSGAGGPGAARDLPPAVLELVRPIRIDSLRVSGVALPDDLDLPAALDEGKQVRSWIALPAVPDRVVIEGLIWAEPFRRVVAEDRGFGRAAAGFVFAEDRHQELDHDEMMALAVFGRAVSPVTSYVAVEPGVRPSTAGIVRSVLGGSGSGFGRGAGGLGGRRGGARSPELASLVEPLVARCRSRIPGAAQARVSLAVETTWAEIVDVAVRRASSRAFGACVADAVWDLTLPDPFAAWSRLSFSLDR